MSTRPAHENQQLIDPVAFEQAGRHFREWLDRLLGRSRSEPDTSIAWESGEPDEDSPPPAH